MLEFYSALYGEGEDTSELQLHGTQELLLRRSVPEYDGADHEEQRWAAGHAAEGA